MTKTVSIIIPTYNRADLLKRAIISVIKQTYTDWELLIVDDGSTDNTKEVVQEFINKYSYCDIKYFYKENGGPASARNVGIKNAKGKYIAFLDSDDEWLPKKLEKQIAILETQPQYDFCFTADVLLYEKGNKKIRRECYYKNININDIKYIKLSASFPLSSPSSHIYRKEVFKNIGLFDENPHLIGLEDNEWGARGGYILNGYYLDEALTIYRVHSYQTTAQNVFQKRKRLIEGMEYIIQKNFNVLSRNKKALSFRYQQLAHICMLNKEYKKARFYFRKATKLNADKKSKMLLLISYFPILYKLLAKLRSVLKTRRLLFPMMS